MIKFFRQSYVIQYVVIALLAIALWIPSFVSGKATMGLGEPVIPIFNLVDGLLGSSPILQHLVAFLLLVLVTLIFNNILVKNQIVGKVSTMGAFVFANEPHPDAGQFLSFCSLSAIYHTDNQLFV